MDRRLLYTAQVAAMLCSPSLFAAQRTFVSSTGSDTNACTLTLPCRSFQAAITAVDPGGEVVALESAGYGPFTINKAVSVVVPPGIYAGVTAGPGVTGVQITAPVEVKLSGLTINGQGGTIGVSVSAAAKVVIEKSTIERVSDAGISAFDGRVVIEDTKIRSTGGPGIRVSGNSMALHVTHSSVENSVGGYGIEVRDGAHAEVNQSDVVGNTLGGIGVLSFNASTTVATISDTHIDKNLGAGVTVQGTSLSFVVSPAYAFLERVTISNNTGAGVALGGAAGVGDVVAVSNSTIMTNGSYGFLNVGPGTFYSRGNNTLYPTDVLGVITILAPK